MKTKMNKYDCPSCRKQFSFPDPTSTRLAILGVSALGGGAATKSIGGGLAIAGLALLIHEAIHRLSLKCPECAVALRLVVQFAT